MYDVDEYDIAGFTVGAVEKDDIIDPSRVKVNDVVIGIASSGVHSNGFSLVRKIVLKELKESSGFLRSEVAKRVDIRHTPELNFVYDESLEYAKRIEDKIKEINN